MDLDASLLPLDSDEGRARVFDEYTGIELPKKEVEKARASEIEFFETLGVWESAPIT